MHDITENARVADLKAKLTGAAENERTSLAGELHDDVQQILFGWVVKTLEQRPVDKA